MKRMLAALFLLLLAGGVEPVSAQSWPAKPVRIIVPFSAGGTVDVLARFLAERLSTTLGQPMLVENKPGAAGNIGTEAVARAAPDGYTLLLSGSPTHAVNPHLYKNLSYDPLRDFAPVALLGAAPNLLVVNPSLPVSSLDELVRLARSKPGQLDYTSAGNGTSGHLAGELLKSMAHLDVRHVPYKGQAEAITGLIRGDVAFAFLTVPATLPHVKSGRLRAIGITSASRSPLAPDVPTIAQSGFPDFEVLAWYGLYAPRGTSQEIVMRVSNDIGKLMSEPATRAKLAAMGAEPRYLAPAPFFDFMSKDSARWAKTIREAGIVPD